MTDDTRRALLLVQMDAAPDDEAELNAWYEEDHLPERAALPGFLTARRFESVDGAPKYLALYELEDLSVLETPEYRALIDAPDPRTKAVGRMVNTLVRKVYVEIPRPDADAAGPRGADGSQGEEP